MSGYGCRASSIPDGPCRALDAGQVRSWMGHAGRLMPGKFDPGWAMPDAGHLTGLITVWTITGKIK